MAGTIVKIKQSSVAGRVPTAASLNQGELALNTNDKKLYSKDGGGAVFEIGPSGVATANEIVTTEFVATSSQTTFSVSYDPANDHVNIYSNGVWLPPTDFTSTSGTTIVLDTGASAGTAIVAQVIKALNLAAGSDIDEHEFVATAGQTSFTIVGGYNGVTSDIEVYVNGVKLRTSDFTSSSGTVIVLGTAAVVNDEVTVRVIKVAVLAAGSVNQTSNTGSAVLPAGTTAQRDLTPSGGYLRWNTTLNISEVYNDNTSAWQDVGQQTLTTEQVQDAVGPMLAGNTESGITVTYDDTNNQIDFTVASQTDENFTTADHAKLDGIETAATADQSDAEIRTAVEAATDSNVFTDADHSKLNAIEASATADQTAAQIKTLYEGEVSAFTDAQFTKLGNIETAATADQTNAEIRTAVEAATDSNVFTDADHSKLNAIEASATADQTDGEIRTAVEAATDSNVFTDADHTKLNAIEALADVTDTANVTSAGALMDSELAGLAAVKATTGTFLTADQTKLDTIETNADVTDTANVVSSLSAGTGVSISAGGVVAVTAVALTTVQAAASQVAHLALTAQEGDVVVRSDENKSYIHNGGVAGTMADYTLLATPTDAVLSVNNQTGAITAAQIATAVEAASNSNTFTDADHTKLNAIAASANNYVHPNHSGDVTSTGDGATVIGANKVLTSMILDDNVTAAKLANSINTDIATGVAALPKAGGTMTGTLFAAGVRISGELDLTASTTNYIDYTDSLRIRSTGSSPGYESSLLLQKDGAVTAYHNGAVKLATTSAGIDVTGTVQADKVEIGNGVGGGTSEILFSDNSSARGRIIYDHSTNPETLILETTGVTAISIDNTQEVSIPNGNLIVGGTVSSNSGGGTATLGSHLDLGDNQKARFGAGDDLQIYHSGADSYIVDTGDGDLYIRASNEIRIQDGNQSNYLYAVEGGDLRLYHGGVEKFRTTSSGIDVTGNIVVSGTVDGVDIASRDSILTSTTTTAGNALPKAGGTMTGALIVSAAVTANNLNVSGVSNLGSLDIYDSGTDTVVAADAGHDLQLRARTSGVVDVYANGTLNTKFTSTGMDVTGTITSDGLTVDGSTLLTGAATTIKPASATHVANLLMQSNSGSVGGYDRPILKFRDAAGTGGFDIKVNGDDANTVQLQHITSSAIKQRIRIHNSGDIAFYEDTGTAQKFVWDASAESLKLGHSSTYYTAPRLDIVGPGAAGDRTAVLWMRGATADSVNQINVRGGDLEFGSGGSLDTSPNMVINGSAVTINSVVSVPDGTAAAPSITNTGDSNTGIYFPAENTIALVAGANTKISANVSSITHHVPTSIVTAASTSLYLQGGDGNSKNIVFRKTTGGAQQAKIMVVSDDMRFTTGATTERMRIDSAGNVGIGTSSPTAALEVNSGSSNLVAVFKSTDTEAQIDLVDTTGSAQIRSRNDFRFYTDGGAVRSMTIDPSGNVGIGADSPKTLLNVAAATGGILTLESTDTSLTTGDVVGGVEFYANDASTNGTGVVASVKAVASHVSGHSTDLTFSTAGTSQSTAVEHLRINSSGNVGINTSTPTEKLSVSGNISVTGTVDGVDIAARDAILTSTTTTAGNALPKAGGTMTGAITTNSTFDGVDIAVRDAVLTSTTATANAALPKAGGIITGAVEIQDGTNEWGHLEPNERHVSRLTRAEAGNVGTTGTTFTDVYGEADLTGIMSFTTFGYTAAITALEAVGARLPTLAEIMDGVGLGSGQSYDSEYLWTSTHAGHNKVWVCYGAYASGGGSALRKIVDITDAAEVYSVRGFFDVAKANRPVTHTSTGDINIGSSDIALTGTVDGVDIAARDAILTSTTTTANNALPKAGGTMTGDTLRGNNIKSKFGAGNELTIWSDGTDSIIAETGTGGLFVRSGAAMRLQGIDQSNFFIANQGGSVNLYHNNANKLDTTSTGINVTGEVASTTVNTASYITVGTLDTKFSENNILFRPGGAAYIDHATVGQAINFRVSAVTSQDTAALSIHSAGTNISSGNLQIGGTNVINSSRAMYNLESFKMADSKKAYFGSSNDMEIYHDGGNSYVRDVGTGALVIQSNGTAIVLEQSGTGNNMILAETDGAVTLYNNGAAKLATTSTGVDISGTLTADKLVSRNGIIELDDNGTHNGIINSPAALYINFDSDNTNNTGEKVIFGYGRESTSGGATVLEVSSTGIDVTGSLNLSNHLDMPDNATVKLGTSDDLQIYHDGLNSYVKDTGTGTLNLQGATQVLIGSATTGEVGVQFVENAGVNLRHNNVNKLETTSTGVDVTGTMVADAISATGSSTIGGNVTGVTLNVHATNTAGAGAMTAAIKMKGYEGRGIGTFYEDVTHTGKEWYAGLPYSGGFAAYQIGYSATGSQAEYVANSLFTVKNDGKVGIGYNAPAVNLDVRNGTNNANVTVDIGPGTSAVDKESYLNLYRRNSSSVRSQVGVFRTGIPIAGIRGAEVWSYQTLGLVTANSTAGHIVFKPKGVEKMRIDAAGNVSIGSTSNLEKLYVNGNIRADGSYKVGGTVVIDSSRNITAVNTTLTGYLRGPASFVIDPAAHGDDTGTVVIAGNLQVDGTTTTINSTVMSVNDLNLTLADGAANAAAANGAGITIAGAAATLTYASTGDKFVFNKPLDVTGTVSVDTLEFDKVVYGAPTSEDFYRIKFKDQGGTANDVGIGQPAAGSMVLNFTPGSTDYLGFNAGTEGELMRLSAAGHLGIGANAPKAKLSIDQTSDSGAIHITRSDQTGSNFATTHASIFLGDEINNAGARHQASINAVRELWSGSPTALTFKTSPTVNNATERMRIDSAGNVGIGTIDPLHRLHVTSNGTTPTALIENLGTGSTKPALLIKSDSTWSSSDLIKATSGTSDVEKFRVSADGNIFMAANVDIGGDIILPDVTHGSASTSLSTVTQTTITSFVAATYGAAKFIITAVNGVNRQITELLVTHNGTTAVATEYGTVVTSGTLATFDVDINAGSVRVLATGASASTVGYKIVKTLIE